MRGLCFGILEILGSGGVCAPSEDAHQIMPRILPIMRIPPGVRSRLSSLKLPTASLCAIAGLVIAWPSGLFPGNHVPIPDSIASIGDSVVAKIVMKGSLYLLETAGVFLPVKDGLLQIGDSAAIDVTAASGGLRILLAVLAISTAAAALQSKPVWERLFIIGSGVPIAMLCGVFRVTTGCLLLAAASESLAGLILFEFAGWVTLVAAWGLLLAERELLSRLLIPPPAREVVPVFRGVELSAWQQNSQDADGTLSRNASSETASTAPVREHSLATSNEQSARHTEPILGAAT